MTQPGRASIEIVGDVSKLGRQLKRDAQRAVDNIDLDTDGLAAEIGTGFKKGAAEGVEAFDEAERDIAVLYDKIKNGAQEAAEEVSLHFEEGGVRIIRTFKNSRKESDGLFDGLGDKAREAGDTLRRSLITPVSNGFARMGDLIGSAAASLAGLATSAINPAQIATILAYTAAFTVLIPLVIGLGAALADLAGIITLLPGILGAAASSLIVGMIAFQGFGDAISAVIDGDPEKIAEALEKLAPAAQKVVKEFQALLPLFRQVGDSIQQEFFEPLVGQVRIFGEKVLPRLRNELDTLAQSMGRAFGHLGDLATDANNVGILERLLASTSKITDELGVAVANLGQAFLNALDASLPSLEKLSGGLADAITNFAGFINKSIEDGSFQAFLDDALATLKELVDLGKALGDLFAVLFSSTDDAGRGFLGTLTDVTQRLTEFFESAEGQDALGDFVSLIEFAGFVVGQAVSGFRNLVLVFSLVDNAIQATGQFFSDLWDDITVAWAAIVAGTSSAVDSIGAFFTDLWDDIVEIWDGIVETIGSAIDSVVTFFEELPGKIWGFIQSIPGLVADAFNAMIDQTISILAAGVAAIIVLFTDIPRQIEGAYNALLMFLAEIWQGITDDATNAGNNIVAWFEALPAKLAEIGQGILDWATNTWNTVVATIGQAVNTIIEFVSSLPGKIGAFFRSVYDSAVTKFNELVAFVKGIPGRVLSALGDFGTLLYNSGKKVIQGLINGISDKIGDLRKKVSEAVSAIRDHLPFSPAKIGPLSGSGSPDIAGAKIAEMIAAGLDSGQPLLLGAAGRAAGAVADAGVTPLATATPGGQSPVMSPTSVSVESQPIFLVRIGDEDIEAYVEKIVDERVQVEVRRLVAGTRGM